MYKNQFKWEVCDRRRFLMDFSMEVRSNIKDPKQQNVQKPIGFLIRMGWFCALTYSIEATPSGPPSPAGVI